MRAILLLGQTDMMSTATSAMQQCFRDMQTKILTFLIFFKIKNQKSENMPSLPCKLEMKCWMPAPHRQQLWEGGHHQPLARGRRVSSPTKGILAMKRGAVTSPACSWALCRGMWGGKVGPLSAPQMPGQAASHFSCRITHQRNPY